ncbi:MAG: phosphonate ABC transporter ATP-binding protein [bacterium]
MAVAAETPSTAADTASYAPHRGPGAITVAHLNKVFPGGTHALRDVSFTLPTGRFVAIIGSSGAGKSTILRCINRLIDPTDGQIVVGGQDLMALSGIELVRARRQIGFIFQQHNLVRRLTVLQNVLTGRIGFHSLWRNLIGNYPLADLERCAEIVDSVGLLEKLHTRADHLSGGQQQRVAIARALAQEPTIFLADEPTASLDPKLSHSILGLLKEINRAQGLTILINLHDLALATQYADWVLGFRLGELVFDGPITDLSQARIDDIYSAPVE